MTTRDFQAAQNDHLAQSLSRVFIETRAKRVANNLKQMREDAPVKEAADCFDTALEAVEEGVEALTKGTNHADL